jgi:U3 small nucleolar RNA-associated protein 24
LLVAQTDSVRVENSTVGDAAVKRAVEMGRARQTRRSALAKRRLNPNDSRIRANQKREEEERKAREGTEAQGRRIVHAEKPASHLFFRYNMALGPPYRVLVRRRRVRPVSRLDALSRSPRLRRSTPTLSTSPFRTSSTSSKPCSTACWPSASPSSPTASWRRLRSSVCASAWRSRSRATRASSAPSATTRLVVACLRLWRGAHRGGCAQGTYADDCIVKRVQQHNCFIVATCDKDLKRRIRRIPGVPIMFISNRKYAIERFADVSK